MRLVEDPEAVVIEKRKVNRPVKSTRRVSTIQCPREQHVLRSDENCGALGLEMPVFGIDSAHEHMYIHFDLEIGDPLFGLALRLLDENAHGQAINESPWRWLTAMQITPQPADHGCRGLARAGRCAQQMRERVSRREFFLEWVTRFAIRRAAEEFSKIFIHLIRYPSQRHAGQAPAC